MNHQRALAILDNQTALAQRVFKAVPIKEWWSVQQIMGEMNRHGAHNNSVHALNGSLRALRESGLVDQMGDNYRSAVKPLIKKATPMTQSDKKEATAGLPLVDRLINEAVKLRSMADVLDGLAVEIDDEIAKAGKQGSEKLRLLRELLSE